MKIAFKNFITTLRRYKMASVLNIAGLTLAFTAFYVMMVQVTYDLGYNRSIRDADRILTVNANWIGGGFSLISPRGPFEAALAQCPEVEGSAIITRNWEGPVWVQKSEFSFTEYAAVMDMLSLPSRRERESRTRAGRRVIPMCIYTTRGANDSRPSLLLWMFSYLQVASFAAVA